MPATGRHDIERFAARSTTLPYNGDQEGRVLTLPLQAIQKWEHSRRFFCVFLVLTNVHGAWYNITNR